MQKRNNAQLHTSRTVGRKFISRKYKSNKMPAQNGQRSQKNNNNKLFITQTDDK